MTNYRHFLASVHERFAYYGAEVRYMECFVERLQEERPDIIDRIDKTGRKLRGKNGKAEFRQEVWSFIKDVW